MSTGREHKGDTVGSLLAPESMREEAMKSGASPRKGYSRKNSGLSLLHMQMKETQRNGRLMAGFELKEEKAQYSAEEQQRRIAAAEAKRARRAGKALQDLNTVKFLGPAGSRPTGAGQR